MRPKRNRSYLPLLNDESSGENPLINRTFHLKPSWAKRISRWILGVTLLPVRAVLILIVIAFCFITGKIATIGLKKDDYHPLTGKPLPRWRAVLFEPVYFGARLTLALLGFHRIKVKGKCAPWSDAPIIVANHVSGIVEGLYLMKYAKVVESSYMNPFLKLMVLGSSGIMVDRSDPNSRHITKQSLLKRSKDNRWPQTLVFPEGSCTNGNGLIQFKQGAFLPGCAVQPVLFHYHYHHHDPSFTFPHSTVSFMVGLCREVANYMEVEYLPVYRPTDAEVNDPTLFASGVQQVMAEALGVSKEKFSSEDCALASAAKQLNMPLEAAMVQWPVMNENFNDMRVKDAVRVLRQFRNIDQGGTGRVDFVTFANSLEKLMDKAQVQFPHEDLRSMFELLDVRGDGYLDFQEYLCGVALLNGHGQQKETTSLKWIFDCFSHGQLHLSQVQFKGIISRVVPDITIDRLQQLFEEADRDADGQISQDEFINFAMEQRGDLCLDAKSIFGGLPLSMDPI